ncbi:glycerophosphodiester phosphodiesterase [Zavarzinella formosa]|uniref:glycerophosphodiester phosphodiesterase n=1 Tax=Zavarzinella formosa TaxID=360055 RepID=UPI000301A139|nr:glycerophosphodiester phosphodiesterase family protein [Zavarzinella formosa]
MPAFSRHAIMAVFVALLGAGLAMPAEPTPFAFFEPVQPPRSVQVVAHRGISKAAPESTRRAIEMCIQDYFEWVEIDVRLTKDGRHIVFHNDRLDGRTDGKGLVSEHTLEQLQSLDTGSHFSPRFAGEKLHSLAECLKIGKGKVNFYLDCKGADPALLVKEIIDAGMEKQVVAYDRPEAIAKIRELSKNEVPVMTKWRPVMGEPTAFAKKHGLAAVEIDADDVTPVVCKAFRETGVKTQAKVTGVKWDNPKTWSQMIAAGVDWLQTDKPLEVHMSLFRAKHPTWPVKVAYHRGANRYAPENTLPAIELAASLGADYAEIDIRTTKDGKFFLLHDNTFNRTTSGKGKFSDATSDEIVKLEAGSWFGKPYAGAKVPSLDEALTAMGDRTHAYLDCKDISPENLAIILRQRKFLDRSAVCQSVEYLTRLKKIEPTARGMASFNKITEFDKIVELKPFAVDAKWAILSKDMIDKCHAAGIQVFSDSLGWHESVKDYRQAIEWGIDLIQTDHPARMLRAMELHFADKK